MSTEVEILTACHNRFDTELPCGYKKIQVSAATAKERWPGCLHDDEGDNISAKNPYYCELTALYWGWKNSDAEIKGLCHYRRYFSDIREPLMSYYKYSGKKNISRRILKSWDVIKDLEEGNEIILTVPYAPYPLTAKQDLLRFCRQEDVEAAITSIGEMYPDYLETALDLFNARNLSYCNMMIAGKEVYNAYCAWLFPLLFKMEEEMLRKEEKIQDRVFGYLAEFLLNVYVEKNCLKKNYYSIVYMYGSTKERLSSLIPDVIKWPARKILGKGQRAQALKACREYMENERRSAVYAKAEETVCRSAENILPSGTVRPNISIIVPVYNVRQFLEQCLESLEKQTYKDYEVILVDDGSTDGSDELCARFEENNLKFKFFRQAHKGISAVRNYGLSQAKGNIIAFVDSDDWVSEDLCAVIAESMEETNSDITAFGRGTIWDNDFKPEFVKITDVRKITDSKEAIGMMLEDKIYGTVWSMAYRKELLEGIVFPEGREYEDTSVLHKILDKACRICLVPEVLYFYRRKRAGSIVNTRSINNCYDEIISYLERMTFVEYKYPEYISTVVRNLVFTCVTLLGRISHAKKAGQISEEDEMLYARIINKVKMFISRYRSYIFKNRQINIGYRMYLRLFRLFPEMTTDLSAYIYEKRKLRHFLIRKWR